MKTAAYTLSFCSLMAALGTAVLLTCGLIPMGVYCATIFASLFLIPVTEEFDRRRGRWVWCVTALLALLLCPDRECSFFYLFFGYYPLLREAINDRVKPSLRVPLKLLWSLLSGMAMYALLCFVFRLDAVLKEFAETARWINAAFFLLLSVVMLIFDRALASLTLLYRYKLRPRLGRRS